METVRRGVKHAASARFEINADEAAIFRDYAAGQSMQTIAFALNREGMHFPAQGTQRGPQRRGWAVSSVRVILRNEKYGGAWVWNKRRFVKHPDTGHRRALPRPAEGWIRQEHPELRIVDTDLWESVQERLAFVEKTYGDQRPRKERQPPEGSGGCLPTGGCGGPQRRMLHSAGSVPGRSAITLTCEHVFGVPRVRAPVSGLDSSWCTGSWNPTIYPCWPPRSSSGTGYICS